MHDFGFNDSGHSHSDVSHHAHSHTHSHSHSRLTSHSSNHPTHHSQRRATGHSSCVPGHSHKYPRGHVHKDSRDQPQNNAVKNIREDADMTMIDLDGTESESSKPSSGKERLGISNTLSRLFTLSSDENRVDRFLRRKIKESEVTKGVLACSWDTAKKWRVLIVIFIVQCSMNMNASIYANAIEGMTKEFKCSHQLARVGQAVFLICYGFGCELWAPWSEEIGRKPILQTSLFLVNIFQIPAALSPNMGGIIAARVLGGFASAGGSVTLGMIPDMFTPEDQPFPVAFIVLSSVGGSLIGPIAGGFLQQFAPWRWVFWVQLIFGAVTQCLHYVLVPETEPAILMDKDAKYRRSMANGDPTIFGPNEIEGRLFERMTLKKLATLWTRPFWMLLTEPIVFCLSLLSGFSDALIFISLESYSHVFAQWNFNPWQIGLTFIGLLIGYLIAYISFIPSLRRQQKIMRDKGAKALIPEQRLSWLCTIAPLLTIGLVGLSWTSLGPAHHIPWIAPVLFSVLIGMVNYAVYMATIDYMVATYGRYAASACGSNGLARDVLAGAAAMFSAPFYNLWHEHTLEWPTTVLAILSVLVIVPIYVFYWKGEAIRARSRFANKLAADEDDGVNELGFEMVVNRAPGRADESSKVV